MRKHSDEEDRVEVRNRCRGADDRAPKETHDPVGNVVWLAGVRPEAGGEQAVAIEDKVNVSIGVQNRKVPAQLPRSE